MNTQVDASAGGDPVETPATSPIREVENVAQAIAGMGARLAQTAEQDARLETERRLLVSSIAHDLRTPLFALRGYLDAIATGIGDPGQRLEQAQVKAQQIDRLITGLFDYARADFDKRPRLQTTDLADAVTDETAAFELAADERGVKLQVTAHTGHSVRIDPDGYERALANVIDNALRHTPPGGTVEVTCGEDADNAFVRVVDNGPGIPPDILPGVVEPTVRADSARNSRDDGAGLGLAIATRLLRNKAARSTRQTHPDAARSSRSGFRGRPHSPRPGEQAYQRRAPSTTPAVLRDDTCPMPRPRCGQPPRCRNDIGTARDRPTESCSSPVVRSSPDAQTSPLCAEPLHGRSRCLQTRCKRSGRGGSQR
jgi:hypothetical protein